MNWINSTWGDSVLDQSRTHFLDWHKQEQKSSLHLYWHVQRNHPQELVAFSFITRINRHYSHSSFSGTEKNKRSDFPQRLFLHHWDWQALKPHLYHEDQQKSGSDLFHKVLHVLSGMEKVTLLHRGHSVFIRTNKNRDYTSYTWCLHPHYWDWQVHEQKGPKSKFSSQSLTRTNTKPHPCRIYAFSGTDKNKRLDFFCTEAKPRLLRLTCRQRSFRADQQRTHFCFYNWEWQPHLLQWKLEINRPHLLH